MQDFLPEQNIAQAETVDEFVDQQGASIAQSESQQEAINKLVAINKGVYTLLKEHSDKYLKLQKAYASLVKVLKKDNPIEVKNTTGKTLKRVESHLLTTKRPPTLEEKSVQRSHSQQLKNKVQSKQSFDQIY